MDSFSFNQNCPLFPVRDRGILPNIFSRAINLLQALSGPYLENIGPQSFFVWTSLHSVGTPKTPGQYSPTTALVQDMYIYI